MSGLQEKLDSIRRQGAEAISRAADRAELDRVKSKFLGRKGVIAEVFRSLGELEPDQRPAVGKLANEVKNELFDLYRRKAEELAAGPPSGTETGIDLTLPGVKPWVGHRHPISLVMEEVTRIFFNMGFSLAEGPEVELDYYNFEALNFPPDHPSRDIHDTFFLGGDVLLRTHTSPVQVRTMEKMKPPLRIIAPGRAFRCEATDASHAAVFHQIEGFYVDVGVTFADLKGTLLEFVHQFFGPDIKMRFRPGYFPFTEPSAEADIMCVNCHGTGCRVCKGTGWLEIFGAGMIDPAVFEHVNYDPEKYTGYAFGMGVERLAMLLYKINDIRLFLENDLRFLTQF